MASRKRETKATRGSPPARTPEERENQLIAKAIDLAERQIEDGSVSAQVQSHFIRLGSTRERLEQSRLREEVRLLESKVAQLESMKNMEELYEEAIGAMRSYVGLDTGELDEGYYED